MAASKEDFDAVDFHILDVGQGDCTLFIDRSKNIALIVDCPARMQAVVTRSLHDLGNPRVNGIIISHWDLDHYGGALDLAAATQCEVVYYNRETMMAFPIDRTVRRAALLRLVEEPFASSIRHVAAHQGTGGTLGNFEWKLLAPSQLHLTEAVAKFDRNLASTVLRGVAHGSSVVVGGDADGRVWQRLLDEGVDLNASVFRWPHHGSPLKGSHALTPSILLDAVNPKYVAISVGTKNRYSHPDSATIAVISSRTTMACTEVTERCHNAVGKKSDHPCGGTLSFTITSDGQIHPRRGWVGHSSVVDGWDSPMCRGQSV
ncbi:MAG: ComEC/Rec2 family competence protein [Gammaproteobacteria bacterium]